ncbi:MAG: disulfide bond corrector protein DsbC [Acidobacteria bacterium OLB17]|nr:MAG: disulfide bond corrector protein DsbC [Acidobacteria bacterium OLB17]MCZ2391060.1 protein-disulfide reductase DsbD N-terminal domain-containing protein [Acidobacteriota bacterium]
MKKVVSLTVFALAFGIFSAAALAQEVSVSVPNGSLARGKSVRVTVTLDIPGGLHVNSNRPKDENLIATVVTPSGGGLRFGAVRYPAGHDKVFGFSKNALNVYEGRVRFSFLATVPAKAKGNSASFRVAVRYQACTDEVCYPPKTKRINVSARIR